MRVKVTVSAVLDLPDGWVLSPHPDEPMALSNGEVYASFALMEMICDPRDPECEWGRTWKYPHDAAEDIFLATVNTDVTIIRTDDEST